MKFIFCFIVIFFIYGFGKNIGVMWVFEKFCKSFVNLFLLVNIIVLIGGIFWLNVFWYLLKFCRENFFVWDLYIILNVWVENGLFLVDLLNRLEIIW